MRQTIADRFWGKVDLTLFCWEWTASKNRDGYGRFAISHRQQVRAHRYAYELIHGPIPDGLVIDHLCRNPGCVNPDHLEPVTDRTNILRGTGPTAANAIKTHCPQGHPYDHTYGPRNYRTCRICGAAATRRYRAKAS